LFFHDASLACVIANLMDFVPGTSPKVMTAPVISAIICTHNRDTYLGAAIDSLLNQVWDPPVDHDDMESLAGFLGEATVRSGQAGLDAARPQTPSPEPPSPEASPLETPNPTLTKPTIASPDYEIIVVDNASSDRTREVVEARLPHPRLRYVYEAVTGLSVARNTGARQAQAPLLAYLDDDAVASATWLQELVAAFAANEKLAIAGGKVTLIWPDGRSRPPWLSDELTSPLGAYDLGIHPCLITNPSLTPRGLNYAIRRSFLDHVGGFDPSLGRIGTKLLSNEEVAMTELALDQGWQVAYLPAALAAHNVAPERLRPAWFAQRGWWQGISEYYRDRARGRLVSKQLVTGCERVLRGVYKSLKYWRDPALRFENWVYAYGQIGYLWAILQGIGDRSPITPPPPSSPPPPTP
jgi:glycosyltransferase involved in cell wall biosynthesis